VTVLRAHGTVFGMPCSNLACITNSLGHLDILDTLSGFTGSSVIVDLVRF